VLKIAGKTHEISQHPTVCIGNVTGMTEYSFKLKQKAVDSL